MLLLEVLQLFVQNLGYWYGGGGGMMSEHTHTLTGVEMLLSDIVFQLHNVFFYLAEKRKAILISSVLPKPFNLFVSSTCYSQRPSYRQEFVWL